MLDSAGVAGLLWDRWTSAAMRAAICRGTGLNADSARHLVTWITGAHDIGKCTFSFALQPTRRQDSFSFADVLHEADLPLRVPGLERMESRFPHGLASGAILRGWLADRGIARNVARSLADIVDAHHGIPSRRNAQRRADEILSEYPTAWTRIHTELLDLIAVDGDIDEVLPHLRQPLDGPTQTLITGLVIMADWIASGAEFFPMSPTGMAARTAAEQLERVRIGFDAVGLTPPWKPAGSLRSRTAHDLRAHMRQRFGWPDVREPRPVQEAVADLGAGLDGPSMLIIEAPTGEGKTEAALVAAELLSEVSGAGGALFAAPTMSTANGLFDRVTRWAARSTSAGEVQSMYLAHSKNRLNRSFGRLHFQGISADQQAEHGDVLAASWLSGRKKGLLSSFTVATVDQVLLMALQGKHSMLRHIALAGKVVIIDEVHAFDAYMSNYLHRALRWLGHYGASVVLLSATLPLTQKKELVSAYQPLRRRLGPGAGTTGIPPLSHDPVTGPVGTAYPLITCVTADSVREVTVDGRPDDLHAHVEIIPDDLEELLARLKSTLAGGGCALVLCNTVARAQNAYARLTDLWPDEVELHHAAFTAHDRAHKETALMTKLGPAAHRGNGRPERLIVVATQVAEQSLDIDVDLLITDIAPADLLIQRIGRLHRHARPVEDRPEGLRSAQVLVRGVLTEDPVPSFDSGASAIYGDRLLISTLALLQKEVLPRGFRRPSDVPGLVQAAYGDAPPIPAEWSQTWTEAVTASKRTLDRAHARSQTFMFPEPSRAESLQDLFASRDHDDATDQGEAAGLAQVRDSDPTVEVIPIVVSDAVYSPLPWMPGADSELFPDMPPPERLARTLAESTVRLPSRLTRSTKSFDDVVSFLEVSTPKAWQESPMLKGQLALPLDESLRILLGGRRLAYSHDLGLMDEGSFVGPSPYSH